jgi:F-type H+-transporting ATPase subunit epsilon
MNTISLQVVTPHGEVFNDDIFNITVPGSDGEFGIYPNHATLLSTLKPGIIKISKNDNTTESVVINWGYVKVSESSIRILIDDAVAISGESESVIMEAVAQSKKLLSDALVKDSMSVSLELQVENIAKRII